MKGAANFTIAAQLMVQRKVKKVCEHEEWIQGQTLWTLFFQVQWETFQ